jgi:hypothetical protein
MNTKSEAEIAIIDSQPYILDAFSYGRDLEIGSVNSITGELRLHGRKSSRLVYTTMFI